MKYFKQMRLSKHFSIIFSFFIISNGYAQLVINKGINELTLIETLVGSGVEVDPESVTINCPSISYGAFGGETNVGVANGLIMTTGDADAAAGPNNLNHVDTKNFSAIKDPDLAMLIPGFEILDACVIEFDFVPKSDTLTFKYVFGSEEYSDFVGPDSQFNDVFGFFMSGPGISGSFSRNAKNIAVVPETEIPISIQTINNGYADYGEPMGPCTNCEYFVFNGDGECFLDEPSCTDETYIQFNGFTTVLTTGIPVVPCEQYHIKLAIADAGDSGYDSGVFIQGQSFSTNGIEIIAEGYEDGVNFPNAAAGCTNAKLTFINNLDIDEARTISYEIGGTAREGVDYESIPNEVSFEAGESEVELIFDILDDGIANEDRFLEIYFFNANCSGSQFDTIQLTIEDFPVFTVSEDQTICEGDEATLLAENGFNYNWMGASFSNPNLATQTVMPIDTTTYLCDIDYGRCKESLSTTVNVIKNCDGTQCPNEITEISVAATTVCAGDYVSLTALLDTLSANFSWDGPAEITDGEFVASSKSCTPVVQTYTVSATCFADPSNTLTASIDITVYPTDITPFLNENKIGCLVGVYPGRLCSPYISVSERQIFDDCSEGEAVFEVSYNLETPCIETIEYRVNYNCAAPYTVGRATVNQAYVCDGAKPDISISNFGISVDASLYYVFHNNENLTTTGYTTATEIYGFSTNNFDEIVQNNIPCGEEIYVSPMVIKTVADLATFSFNEDCTSFGNTQAITFLCPIIIETACVCDFVDGTTFDLYASVSGGFPGLSNNALFTVTGNVFEGTISHAEQFEVLSLPDSSSYQINVEDEIGCTASASETIYCLQKLPIELIGFNGVAMPTGNQLKWETATEINNSHFTINTSKDGVYFEELATISGQGNSSTVQAYNFIDRNATDGITYYQLQQTDFDGVATIEGYVEIQRGEVANINSINLYPNPVNEQLTIQFIETNSQPINVSLTNLQGQIIFVRSFDVQQASNDIQLNTATLSKGVYLIAIDNGADVYYQKLVKQ